MPSKLEILIEDTKAKKENLGWGAVGLAGWGYALLYHEHPNRIETISVSGELNYEHDPRKDEDEPSDGQVEWVTTITLDTFEDLLYERLWLPALPAYEYGTPTAVGGGEGEFRTLHVPLYMWEYIWVVGVGCEPTAVVGTATKDKYTYDDSTSSWVQDTGASTETDVTAKFTISITGGGAGPYAGRHTSGGQATVAVELYFSGSTYPPTLSASEGRDPWDDSWADIELEEDYEDLNEPVEEGEDENTAYSGAAEIYIEFT